MASRDWEEMALFDVAQSVIDFLARECAAKRGGLSCRKARRP
jgi:hypothetical protein